MGDGLLPAAKQHLDEPYIGSKLTTKTALLLQGVCYLIIDEVSMVGAQQMSYIDRHIQEVFGQPGVPFGGVSVITVGEFYHLSPVTKGKRIWLCSTNSCGTHRRILFPLVTRGSS